MQASEGKWEIQTRFYNLAVVQRQKEIEKQWEDEQRQNEKQ